jgi:hypothetical protein
MTEYTYLCLTCGTKFKQQGPALCPACNPFARHVPGQGLLDAPVLYARQVGDS